MATHSSVPAWRIPGMGEPGGLPSMGLHRVGHNWSDLAAAAAAVKTPAWNHFFLIQPLRSPVYVGASPPNMGIFFLLSLRVSLCVRLCVLYRIFVSFSLSVNHLSLSLFLQFLLFLILFCLSPSFFLFKENMYWLPWHTGSSLHLVGKIYVAAQGLSSCGMGLVAPQYMGS